MKTIIATILLGFGFFFISAAPANAQWYGNSYGGFGALYPGYQGAPCCLNYNWHYPGSYGSFGYGAGYYGGGYGNNWSRGWGWDPYFYGPGYGYGGYGGYGGGFLSVGFGWGW